jgi:hypothetical protein
MYLFTVFIDFFFQNRFVISVFLATGGDRDGGRHVPVSSTHVCVGKDDDGRGQQ